MSKKGLVILAVLGALVLGALLVGCGGSSGHSDEWNSYDEGKAESNVAAELSSVGHSPTKGETECIVDALKSSYSPDELYESADADTKQEVEDATKECLEEDSDDASAEEPYEEDYEYQNEGLNELNEERQEEIEEEVENGEMPAP